MQGWIKIHRQLLESPLFTCEPFSKGQAWISIIMLTNHKEGYITVKNGNMLKIERGECGYSELALAKIFKWSRGKVKRFLTFLENEKMIQQKIVENHSIIKVLNYEAYQDDTTNDTTNSTTNGQQTVQQTDINKNDKNDKNDKNIIMGNKKINNFSVPLVEDIKAYCEERQNNVDANRFYDYYQSKGWMIGKNKMKDWKAAVRTWERKSELTVLSSSASEGGYNCGF